jgi:hypothetical protein
MIDFFSLARAKAIGDSIVIFEFACGCGLSLDLNARPVKPNPGAYPCALHRRALGWGHTTFHGKWDWQLEGAAAPPPEPADPLPITRRVGSAYAVLVGER